MNIWASQWMKAIDHWDLWSIQKWKRMENKETNGVARLFRVIKMKADCKELEKNFMVLSRQEDDRLHSI